MTTKVEATITRLIELWRESKAPELPPLIARLGEASESKAAKALRSKAKISPREWLAALD